MPWGSPGQLQASFTSDWDCLVIFASSESPTLPSSLSVHGGKAQDGLTSSFPLARLSFLPGGCSIPTPACGLVFAPFLALCI